jgi:hypothetical protein
MHAVPKRRRLNKVRAVKMPYKKFATTIELRLEAQEKGGASTSIIYLLDLERLDCLVRPPELVLPIKLLVTKFEYWGGIKTHYQ